MERTANEWEPEGGEELTLTVSPEMEGERLDRLSAGREELSRSALSKLIAGGMVTLNGAPAAKNARLHAGDTVVISLPAPEPSEAMPEDIPIDVIYEDDDIIVVNKPVGMVVHPAAGNPTGTLVNALLFRCGASLSGIGGVIRPGIVHRIDKDTGGLLVVAKNDAAHLALAEDIRVHRTRRVYTAVALGNFREERGRVDAPIGRHPTDRKRMAVIRNAEHKSREAVTHWEVLSRGEEKGRSFTLLRCELETGRTHQIRVHMASLGHPLLGDPLYGGGDTEFERTHKGLILGQCLFAGELILTHPRTGEEMHFKAPMEAGMQRVIELLFPEYHP